MEELPPEEFVLPEEELPVFLPVAVLELLPPDEVFVFDDEEPLSESLGLIASS